LTLRDNQICNDEKTACVILSLRQLSSGRDRFKAILFVAALPSRLSRYSSLNSGFGAIPQDEGAITRRRDPHAEPRELIVVMDFQALDWRREISN
jgi:hypothetical protein